MKMMLVIFMLVSLVMSQAVAPTNLMCSDAIELDFEKSTVYHHAITAGMSQTRIRASESAEDEWVTALFFKLTAPEDASYFVSTCGLRTTVSTQVYLIDRCVSGIGMDITKHSEADSTCLSSGKAASYFDMKANQTVYIAIRVNEESAGTVVTNFVKMTIQANTDCPSALEIPSIPYTDICNATGTSGNGYVQCVPTKTPAKWYYLKGDGRYYIADTCSSLTNIDTYIVMINNITHSKEGDCTGAYCTKYNDDGCGKGSHGSAVLFHAEEGKDYHIGVFGKNAANGRYQLNLQSVNNTLPMICDNAQTIQVPFTMTQNMPAVWPNTEVFSEDSEYRVFYFTVIGTGNDVVLSTCPTKSTASGTGVEVVSSCSDNEVIAPSHTGSCGKDQYKVYNFAANVKYIVKFYVRDNEESITMNIKLKGENHYQCEDAMVLKESYTDSVPVSQVKDSAHGCNGKSETHKGAWYHLQKSTQKGSDHYRIGATDLSGEMTNTAIEVQNTCGSNECLMTTKAGFLDLQFDSGSRYIFAYATKDMEVMSVGIVLFDEIQHSVCTSPKEITLPYTSVGFIDVSNPMAVKCTFASLRSFWYSILLSESVNVVVSTVSADTKVDTYIEVITGCYGDADSECIASNDNREGTADKSSKLEFSAYSRTQYNIAVAQKEATPGAHRISLYSTEKLAATKCNTPQSVDTTQPAQTLYVYTEYAYPTKVGGNILKGQYFNIYTHQKPVLITVRTCSVGTEINNLIGLFQTCDIHSDDDGEYSVPNILLAGKNSSNVACGNYGTEFSYLAKPLTNHLLFVAALQNGYDGMIEVELLMEEKEPTEESDVPPTEPSETKPEDNNEDKNDMLGWKIYGGIYYVYTVIVFALVVVGILFFKKKNTQSSSFSTF